LELVVLFGFPLTWTWLAVLTAALFIYILYLRAMAAFLGICGVSRDSIASGCLNRPTANVSPTLI
jgi:hypothetical protein